MLGITRKKAQRTPEQIIGHDAMMQLIFEGYEIVSISQQETVMKHFPEYKSHKTVQAFKIAEIEGNILLPDMFEGGLAGWTADDEYMTKHKPEVGGYFVMYEDGYTSFSPAKAFEEGYTKVETVDSTSDERTTNNTMRHKYRVLTDQEKADMQELKDLGEAFVEKCNKIGSSREMSLAITNAEQAVMWAVKHVTR